MSRQSCDHFRVITEGSLREERHVSTVAVEILGKALALLRRGRSSLVLVGS